MKDDCRSGAARLIDKGAVLFVVGLLAWSAARAAEFPSSSVRPVAACGSQGMRLPGSDICVRLGGVARAEAAARTSGSGPSLVMGASAPLVTGARATRLRAQGRVDFDARTETAAGPIRAFLSVRSP